MRGFLGCADFLGARISWVSGFLGSAKWRGAKRVCQRNANKCANIDARAPSKFLGERNLGARMLSKFLGERNMGARMLKTDPFLGCGFFGHAHPLLWEITN